MSIRKSIHRKLAVLAASLAAGALAVVLPSAASAGPEDDVNAAAFVVSEAQFNQMFPNRNPFYTYSGLTTAMNSYPGFANTGSDTVKKQEAAAFLANVNHETGGLVHIVEQNQDNYPHYCDATPALRLPGRPGRLLRPRPGPAELELQLQGRG